MLVTSEDYGVTWSQPWWLHTDGAGTPDLSCITGLTYLGSGRLIASSDTYWFSSDYGRTWGDPVPVPKSTTGKPMYQWDPMLVDRHAAGMTM